MPGVGSMPIPKSGIQPRQMGDRKTQNKLPRGLRGFVTKKDQEGQTDTTVSEKEEIPIKAKLSSRCLQKTQFPGNILSVAR